MQAHIGMYGLLAITLAFSGGCDENASVAHGPESPADALRPGSLLDDAETPLDGGQSSFDREVLKVVGVSDDGTLEIRDLERAKLLLGDEWESAATDMIRLNDAILAGESPPLTDEALAQATWLGNPSDDPESAYKCIDTCNWGGLCCCEKWWFYCTVKCFCTPGK